jgi:succinate-semialdehyde dehydrogenase/glutarate-semialdehyde dehydrogenase
MNLASGVPSMLIDGEWLMGEGAGFVVRNPANGSVIADYRGASPPQVDAAITSAQRGFEAWSATTAHDRAAVLLRSATLLRERLPALAAQLTLEQGKPLGEAASEWQGTIETMVWYANEGLRTYGRVVPSRSASVQQLVTREPIGPVAGFTPWNFPALSPMRKIAGALAAGCSCVLKPAEETPLSAMAIAQALLDAGLPPGVLNLVYGDAPAIAARLVESVVIRKLTFTGSTAVGKQLAALAGAHAKPLTLELGGHAPVLVFADANLDLAVNLAGAAKFRNAGQICVAPTRFIVHDEVHDAFVARLSAYACALQAGDGADPTVRLGPLANARRLAGVSRLVDDARAGGATVVSGPQAELSGYFWPATVLHGLACDARILREEPFGPLAPVVRFQTFDEAVTLANGVSFGLAAYLFTESLAIAHRAAAALQAGMVGVNTCKVSQPELPFGGVKDSGYGREGGTEGLEPYLLTKSVSLAYAPD